MRVEITCSIDAAARLVEFRTNVGTAQGTWAGSELATPDPAHAELDVPDDDEDNDVLGGESADLFEADLTSEPE